MDWLLFACGEQWKINDILKISQDRNEHTDRQRQSLTLHRHWIGYCASKFVNTYRVHLYLEPVV